ncbi:ABC transporter substrate-binding protein [Pseudonocardia humida]|uniref:ABC transporter substrate-binding protein n=1 Tax=Pseudonocardia humida TaxID=2800819 RepID=A0ABT1A6L9_9PSEU|nr:ABC transporter substrate-binding protein [Pseudonocardia humida]MCO1658581.1 ABC transporter substrate-binding protein [Pseudonocardia humida]
MTRSGAPAPRARRSLLIPFAVAAFLITTACSALSGSQAQPQQAAPGPAQPGNLEKTELQVGVLPIVDLAAVQRAQSAGHFGAEGLDVTLVTIQGGAVAIPQLVSGDLDLSWTSWPSVILAQAQGIDDFRVLQPGYETAEKSFQLVTMPDSVVRTPQDLAGKRVATNTFNSITEIMARSAMQDAGVDPETVEFVELPFPDMIPGLQNDQIDAAILLEPFIALAKSRLDARSVLDVAAGPTAELPIAGVATTSRFAQENPNTLAAFERALGKAQYEMADRSVVEQTLPEYTTVEPEIVAQLTLGAWPTALAAPDLQRVSDLMLRFGVLTQEFDVAELLAPPG